MTCEECRDLTTHAFASHADLVYAVQTAAQETERGVLVRDDPPARGVAEREALDSAVEAGAYPGTLAYRFRCTVCGDLFVLRGDTATGTGSWIRNDEPLPTIKEKRR